MREHKFRGKRTDNGEWVEGFYFETPLTDEATGSKPEEGWFFLSWRHRSCISTENGSVYEVIPETVGEFTGKTVKTGEVFEDDIGKSIDGLFLVAWDKEKASFVMHFYDYPNETLYLEEMWDDSEIIGNLIDNPELLKA